LPTLLRDLTVLEQRRGSLYIPPTVKLPKYTLEKNEQKGRWDLKNDATDRTVKSFERKSDATSGGALEKAVGRGGGSVKIQKENGRIQEERTFPGSADPKKSPG
jgi:hypothetical protein